MHLTPHVPLDPPSSLRFILLAVPILLFLLPVPHAQKYPLSPKFRPVPSPTVTHCCTCAFPLHKSRSHWISFLCLGRRLSLLFSFPLIFPLLHWCRTPLVFPKLGLQGKPCSTALTLQAGQALIFLMKAQRGAKQGFF